MKEQRHSFYKHLDREDYGAAVRTLLSMIDEEPSLSNYNFAYSRLRELTLSELGFHNIKIAILSSFTIEFIIPYLYVKCCKASLNPEFYIGGHNLFQQEILDPESRLYKFDPDILIFAVRLQDLSTCFHESFLEYSRQQIESEADKVVEEITSLISTFRDGSNAVVVVHNFETPPRPALGILDNQQDPGQKRIIHRINAAIEDILRQIPGVYVLDYDNLTSLYGKLAWQDSKMWLLAKMPIAGRNQVHLADEYVRFLKPLRGLNRKCLVLDLDNILWGGIIGEDGIEGIELGHTYPGNAFLAFQKEVLKLYNKGIILAINSKNNEADAMEVFEKHPDMILKKKHFASWRVNWQNKVENMKEIAQELNIGLDSIVFVDDSPVEKEFMKVGLPEVLTIDMPSDPAQYCSLLSDITDFEILSFSDEDRQRGEMYRAQVERKKLQKSSVSLEEFYESLDMVATIKLAEVGDHAIPRISQLTQRTNQFNLTTRRYSEIDVLDFIKSTEYYVFYLRLRDKFGDNGIVGASIIKKMNRIECEIDTYLLSCRVLGRTVETAFLSFITDVVKKEGMKFIYGVHIPTKKNLIAADFYESNGFEKHEQLSNEVRWSFNLEDSSVEFPRWIRLETNYGQ